MKENVLRQKDRREREQKAKRPLGQPLVDRPKTPAVVLVRMFLIGSVAVIASIWAIWRHYAHPLPPMLQPAPVTAPSTSASEIEIEVPPPQ